MWPSSSFLQGHGDHIGTLSSAWSLELILTTHLSCMLGAHAHMCMLAVLCSFSSHIDSPLLHCHHKAPTLPVCNVDMFYKDAYLDHKRFPLGENSSAGRQSTTNPTATEIQLLTLGCHLFFRRPWPYVPDGTPWLP